MQPNASQEKCETRQKPLRTQNLPASRPRFLPAPYLRRQPREKCRPQKLSKIRQKSQLVCSPRSSPVSEIFSGTPERAPAPEKHSAIDAQWEWFSLCTRPELEVTSCLLQIQSFPRIPFDSFANWDGTTKNPGWTRTASATRSRACSRCVGCSNNSLRQCSG